MADAETFDQAFRLVNDIPLASDDDSQSQDEDNTDSDVISISEVEDNSTLDKLSVCLYPEYAKCFGFVRNPKVNTQQVASCLQELPQQGLYDNSRASIHQVTPHYPRR